MGSSITIPEEQKTKLTNPMTEKPIIIPDDIAPQLEKPRPSLKNENSSNSAIDETFVDSIQSCIDKYTKNDKSKQQQSTGARSKDNKKTVEKSPNRNPPSIVVNTTETFQTFQTNFVPLFSSPE